MIVVLFRHIFHKTGLQTLVITRISKPLSGIRLPVGMLPVGDYPSELYVELYSYSPFAYTG